MSTKVSFGISTEGCLRGINPTKPSTDPAKKHPKVKEMDMLIAKDMYQMSLQERELALEDVHGIADRHEDPNFANACLLKMESALNRLKPGTVYEEAERMSESYVRNPHKRLMFLRAEDYEPVKAAERMIRFFEKKKVLFGPEKLIKKITVDDLTEDDLETLRAGEGQISPIKDAAGRPIVFFGQRLRKFKDIVNVKRANYYTFMAAMESDIAQVKGIVAVYWVVDTPNMVSVGVRLRQALPIHFASLHVCVNDIPTYVKTCASTCTLPTQVRARYRLHFGSHTECLYELVSFGIPRNSIPVDTDGELQNREHQEWVKRRIEDESKAPPVLDLIQHPPTPPSMASPESHHSESSNDIEFRPNDVLFGRGKAVIDHPGNTKFRRLVDVYMRKYEEAERLEKTCIAEAIVQMIQESNGRFLKREGNSDWEEVDGPAARKKVAHAFRNRRKLHGFGGK